MHGCIPIATIAHQRVKSFCRGFSSPFDALISELSMSAIYLSWLRTSSMNSWLIVQINFINISDILFQPHSMLCHWDIWEKKKKCFHFFVYLFNPANKIHLHCCRLEGRESCKADGATAALKGSAQCHQRLTAPWCSSHKCFDIMKPRTIARHLTGPTWHGLRWTYVRHKVSSLTFFILKWAIRIPNHST